MKINKQWNVLVFPGGTENGLEINKSLRNTKEVNLFSASSRVINHSDYMFNNHFILPDISEEKCLTELNKIIRIYKIDFIFPANSLIIDFLTENRSDIDCKIALPENSIVNLLRSKKKTYDFFKDNFKVTKTYELDKVENFPVFIKPDKMYGSIGAKIINSKEELILSLKNQKDILICEYLPGEEYTVECFSTKNQGVIYCNARTRERIRMGTSMHCESADKKIQIIVEEIADKIFLELGIDGLWFFQVKTDYKGNLTLIEIETRVAGTMAFSRVFGVNLPLLLLYYLSGYEIGLNKQNYELILDRSLTNRYKTNIYYDTVYIDLDDTIIVKKRINLDIIKFLYQCVNFKKRIILISKSNKEDNTLFLRKNKLSELFDEVHWLKEEEKKYDYITDLNSIFIDDSFTQRLEVSINKGIYTFDPSMIEVLVDDRIC